MLPNDQQQQQQQQQQPRPGVQYVFSGSPEDEAYLLESGLQESLKVFPFHNRPGQLDSWTTGSSSLV